MNPNPINEHQWFTWSYFMRTTNRMLAPYEHCDCYREDNVDHAWENCYYHDPIHNISVTYILFQKEVTRGAWYPDHWNESTLPPSVDPTKNIGERQTTTFKEATRDIPFNPYVSDADTAYCLPRTIKPSWDYYFNDTIPNIIQYLLPKPRVLITNIGIWGESYKTQLEDLYQAARTAIPIFIWKKTSARNDDARSRPLYDEWDNFFCNPPKAEEGLICHDLSWTHSYTEKCLIDLEHYVASIYYRMIEESLDLIDEAIIKDEDGKSSTIKGHTSFKLSN